MLKKLTLLALSVAALVAFAAPTAQAANPLIVDSVDGTTVTNITAVSTNTKSVTPAGTLECTTVDLEGHVTVNTNNTASGHGTGTAKGTVPATHTGHCGTSSGFKVHILSVSIPSLHLEKTANGTSGKANFTYTFELTAGIFGNYHCTLHGTGATVTRTSSDTIKVEGKLVGTGGGLCPSEGTITGDFTVTNKATGAPVNIK